MVLKSGFHAQNGSTFHAFIKQDCKQPPENVPVYANLQELEKSNFGEPQLATTTKSGRLEDSTKPVVTDATKLDEKLDISFDFKSHCLEGNRPEKPVPLLPQQNFVARIEEE